MKKIILCILIFLPSLVFGQHEYVGRYMFVTAPNGLGVRMSPSINSNIRREIPYGSLVPVYRRTIEQFTIDGVSDYFYSISQAPDGHWLFGGGYLSERLESNLFLGNWIVGTEVTNSFSGNIIWRFSINNQFVTGMREVGGAGGGIFELRADNTLTLIYQSWDDEKGQLVESSRTNASVRFINQDRMTLIIRNRQYELVRDNRL